MTSDKIVDDNHIDSQAMDMIDKYSSDSLDVNKESNTLRLRELLQQDSNDDSDVDINSTSHSVINIEAETGQLPADAKRAVVSLMRMGAVVASQKPKLYELICRHEKSIQLQLSNLYLRLLLDVNAGIAIVLQQEAVGDGDDDEDNIYTLISRRTLSLYDTLLLLVLRKFYQDRESSGEQRIIVDVERIEAYLKPFLPLTNSTRADKRALNPVLKKMTERKILGAIRGEEGRYEITPVIRYVVNAEFLERLLSEYTKLAKEAGMTPHPISVLERQDTMLEESE